MLFHLARTECSAGALGASRKPILSWTYCRRWTCANNEMFLIDIERKIASSQPPNTPGPVANQGPP